MLALMAAQIDQLGRRPGHLKGNLGNGVGPAGKGHDRTVMIGIRAMIEQGDAGH